MISLKSESECNNATEVRTRLLRCCSPVRYLLLHGDSTAEYPLYSLLFNLFFCFVFFKMKSFYHWGLI